MADTATASPAPDPPQATPDSLPEVTVSNTRLPAAPGAQPAGGAPLTDMPDSPFTSSDPYVRALANVDAPGGIASVEQAIAQSPEEKQAQAFDAQVTAHENRSAEWEQKSADLAEQYANWIKTVSPEMAHYAENTPTRQGIYAANMHVAPLLAIMSTIGGKLTRASGLQMLAATTGAVTGLNAGNEQAYQENMNRYKMGLEAFKEQVGMQQDYYNAMMKSYAGRADAEEKAAAAAERMAGNIRTDEQKKMATAVQAKRAIETGVYQLDRIGQMQFATETRRQIAGLDFQRGQALGQKGLDAPLSAYSPNQVLGILAANQITLRGGRTTLAGEVQGIQTTMPNLTLRQLVDTMREKQLDMREATVAIQTMARRSYPTAQAYAALTVGDANHPSIFSRLETSAKRLDFGSSQVRNQMRIWEDTHWSTDPNVRAYMTDLEDARTELAVVLSRGGQMSDHARTWAEEALPTVTSQQGLIRSIRESTAIGQSVLRGDERAMAMVLHGGHLSDIFNQTSTFQKTQIDLGQQPAAGVRLSKPDANGDYWRKFPNGYLQNEKTGQVVAPVIGPDGKATDKWRVVSGQPDIPRGQGVGGAGATMDYAHEGGWGEYDNPQNQYGGGGGGQGGGYGGGPYPRGPNLPWTAASEYIKRYESMGGQNVMNYMYQQDPQRRTASGPWQITASNFHEYGRRLGIDTTQWQYAMDAPENVQEQIAEAMYQEQGFAPWAPYNQALARALRYG